MSRVEAQLSETGLTLPPAKAAVANYLGTERMGSVTETNGAKRVNDSERAELATAYVALSNAHATELIRAMFEQTTTYHSSNVGSFEGPHAIGEMMTGFFTRFPDVHWNVQEYRSSADETVEFEFLMTATEASTGQRIERKGLERIAFTHTGHISRIDVTTR